MKKVTFDYDGNEYTLEFDRDSVRKTEQMGFNIAEVGAKPATMYPILFKGAFIKHHKRVSGKKIENIFDDLCDLDELMEALIEMYAEALNSMFERESTKNVKWSLS